MTNRFFWLLLLLLTIDISCRGDLASETVYLTWQRDPTTTMTIQWLSLLANVEDAILLQQDGSNEWEHITGSHFTLPRTNNILVHRVELSNLKSDTPYRFKLPESNEELRFKTMPSKLEEPIRFVVGGDMYHDGVEFLKSTSLQAAKHNPRFGIVGGDIAYAVEGKNQPEKVGRWIEWIRAWSATMKDPSGRLIPVLAAVGNHDVVGQYKQTPAQAQVFLALFPRPNGTTYSVLDFGDYLSVVLLDSGHAAEIEGTQSSWLKSVLEDRRRIVNRIAVYHVPAYPSIRAFDNEWSSAIRRHWVPIFENQGIQLAFEHHDHAYKRTHPLVKSKVATQGVVYCGDGAWGVEEARTPKTRQKRPYLAKFVSVRHFIMVTLDKEGQKVAGIDDRGQQFDSYAIPLVSPPIPAPTVPEPLPCPQTPLESLIHR